MSNSLTSHEDLTPYINQLSKILELNALAFNSQFDLSSDSEIIIKDLLAQIVDFRKSMHQCSYIAKKFLDAYHTCNEALTNSDSYLRMQEKEIFNLTSKITKLEKEIEIKDDRYESIALEATDMERAFKGLNNELTLVKRERDTLKVEMENKQQLSVKRAATMQQRQKIIVEVEKERSGDKTLTKSIELLKSEMEFKLFELETVKKHLSDLRELYNNEKLNSETLKTANQKLLVEISIKRNEIDDLLHKDEVNKEKLKNLSQELMIQKAFNDSLIKEHEKERSNSLSRLSRNFDEDFIHESNVNHAKHESLGAYMEELEDSSNNHKDLPLFYVSTSLAQHYPQTFMIDQRKTMCSTESVSLFPPVAEQIINCDNTSLQTLSFSIEKLNHISITPIRINSISEESDKIHSERLDNIDSYQERDPVIKFFIDIWHVAMLDSEHKEKIGNLPIKMLYKKVIKESVPFNLWDTYIVDYIKSNLVSN